MSVQMVASAGVHLSVRSSGNADGPTIILIHGYPDNQDTWDRIVPLLEPDFHVVTYDVRGAGGSSAPETRKGYRIKRLLDDLVAVMERVRPDGGPVHLVGHDWGGVQSWAAVMREGSDQRFSGRIASYTAIASPGLDQFGFFVSSSLRHREVTRLLKQVTHSWYIGFFRLPYLPELAFRRFGGRIRSTLTHRQHLEHEAHWSETFSEDAANGVNLYRANGLEFTKGTTKVPVQLIVPNKDDFITTALYAHAADFAPDLRRIDIVAGHWVIRTHPEVIAGKIASFVLEKA